ncbi:MAG: class I SAM-dependent methyltransferase [Patescibacteria group bacterium]|jgi:SAM-dependent methyltransferase
MDIIQKTRDDYNKIASFFAETRSHPGELVQFKPFIADGQQILDWGCGNGRLLYMLEKFKINYFGLDQSKGLLNQAEAEHLKLIKNKTAAFFCTAHREKKFPPETFDLIFLIASFHHLPDKKSRLKLLKKLYQECKTGGKMVMTNWNLDSVWAKNKLKIDWEKTGDDDFLIPWKDKSGKVLVKRYYHNFQRDEIKELAVKAGWKVLKLYYSDGPGEANKKTGKNLVLIAEK